jgi:hypothetical protein
MLEILDPMQVSKGMNVTLDDGNFIHFKKQSIRFWNDLW